MKPLEEIKGAFASPKAFKSALQTTDGHDGNSNYNKDLLPSPPGNQQYLRQL
jgi:hypothetical protein